METGSPSWTCMNFQGGTPNKYRKNRMLNNIQNLILKSIALLQRAFQMYREQFRYTKMILCF